MFYQMALHGTITGVKTVFNYTSIRAPRAHHIIMWQMKNEEEEEDKARVLPPGRTNTRPFEMQTHSKHTDAKKVKIMAKETNVDKHR